MVWEWTAEASNNLYAMEAHTKTISEIKKCGNYVLTASKDQTIKRWTTEVRQGTEFTF